MAPPIRPANPVPPPPPPPPPVPNVNRVDQAVGRINDAMSQGVFDWDVTHGDLANAQTALSQLTPQEQSLAVSKLSDETIATWMSEANGLNGGLSADEKRDFFHDLAQNLDGAQLARVASQARFGRDAQDLGAAIGQVGGRSAVDFVQQMGSKLDGETRIGNFSTGENVVARTIGAMNRPVDVNDALGRLSPDQRRSLGENTYRAGGELNAPDDVAAYNGLTAAIARSGSIQTRNEFFGYAAEASQDLRDDLDMPLSPQDFPALDPYYNGMSTLFKSDPRAMVDTMFRQETGMKNLTNYLEIAVIKGDTKMIGELGQQVRSAPAIDGVPNTEFARFEHDFDPGTAENFYNAKIDGYFTGAAMAAAANVDADAEKRSQLAVSILTGGAATVAPAIPVGGQIALGAGSVITQVAADRIVKDASDSRQDFFSAMHAAGMPRNAQGELSTSGAREAFNSAVGEVLDAHALK